MNNSLLPLVSGLYGVKQSENLNLTEFEQWLPAFGGRDL